MNTYRKPKIEVKKIRLNLFLRNRYKDAFGFPVGQAFAQSQCTNCGGDQCYGGGGGGIQPPSTGSAGLKGEGINSCISSETHQE